MRRAFYLCLMLNCISLSTLTDCGITYNKPNLKIIGGVEAVQNSWPSVALVVFRYTLELVLNHTKVAVQDTEIECGGTLISRNVVMTAGHCIISSVNFKNKKYPVTNNSFHSDLASMYTVYLGLHDKNDIFLGKIKFVRVSRFLVVRLFFTK